MPERDANVAFRLQNARRVIGILNTCRAGKELRESGFEQAGNLARQRTEFLKSGPAT